MTEDKGQRAEPSSNKDRTSEPYEVRLFAEKYGITLAEAEALIREHGNDRAMLDQAAAHLRAS
ncbi:MAG: DUF3606 domain-containing protein [Pseudomonadota bacterium]|uniref:hypothetical protein n=1 Tax=Phenylobacterium sp. TaxID=1871053 RepID=UPI0025ED1B85|nr:hypothetical protein [Phenylobacterium sp.]MBT9471988.1 DUF3606 domain-containing protein [Phenylobacterium sp.]